MICSSHSLKRSMWPPIQRRLLSMSSIS
jgi:hypothetical protein